MSTKASDIRRRVLQDTDLIPPLPEVVVRVIALLNEGETEPEELEKLLSFDHVLVARVLGMVNSPFFRQRREIRSVRDAIMVLGYQNLRSLLMVTSASKFMKRNFAIYGHDERGLWSHSVCVGAGARCLAAHLDENPMMQEELFIAALLHDIGKMVLARHLAYFPEDRLSGFESIVAMERELLGITHAEAGTLVAAKWNLSPLVSIVIDRHHGSDCTPEFERHVSIVRLADGVAHDEGIGYAAAAPSQASIDDADLRVLDLTPDEWEPVREQLIEAMHKAVPDLSGVAG